MVAQERSARTRQRLVHAAAVEIDENGYERATLTRICKYAQLSIGALTFHFNSKRDLADAVRADARALTNDRMKQVAHGHAPGLDCLIHLTGELAHLLETEVVVRSAARLERDCPGDGGWLESWLPAVRCLLREAQRSEELRPGVDPQVMTALAVHLVTGAETFARASAGGADPHLPAVATQLERMWEVVLRGAVATP
ncbi:TetR/AcrR family transcriptional regulator [Streptomyces angustmyceticus]|uniref:TetR family transcriptional regulator n=1 Tax=Streptomyces angustmyceticus TaxID=285578 RepID=A0A5J4LBA5_9ACTN|nr:TetR/AcrR family transcriptional regulator [Streptomyces angustmyceticus]UAL66413.1 TetR/AcrR family transcriptional regulator [Streptomyces angustmyceticus]GES28780.1 TetR family transcriptional regulator [Streptomyces angustmyceticus]